MYVCIIESWKTLSSCVSVDTICDLYVNDKGVILMHTQSIMLAVLGALSHGLCAL